MEQENTKRSIIGTILYALFIGLFIFIMSCFAINSCKMSDSDIADDVIFDETTKAVYESDKDGFEVRVYNIEKRFEAVEANKLLQLKYFYYIPEAKQMQLTIKYSTDYAAAPTKESIPLIITLKDHNGKVISDTFYECDEKQGYGYIRMAWNGVEFTSKSEYTLFVDQEKDGEIVNRGTFLMQKASTAYEDVKLTKKNAPYIFG